MDIAKLVKKSKNGNKLAFSNLIKICEKDLYRVAIAITKNEDDALDCIQETIVQSYISIENLKHNEYFKTWIIKILINKCNELIKKNKKIVDLNNKLQKENVPKEYIKLEIKDSINQLEDELKILVMVLDNGSKVDFSCILKKAKSVKDISELGPTTTNKGITITAVVNEEKNKLSVNLLQNIDNISLKYGEPYLSEYELGKHGENAVYLIDTNNKEVKGIYEENGYGEEKVCI